MAYTEAEVKEALGKAIATLNSVITDPKPSYKIGDIEIKYNEYVNSLTKTIETYHKILGDFPYEEEVIWRPV